METLPYVYGFGPAVALILVLIWREARRAGFAPDRVAAAMAACAAGAVIGSKVLMFDFHAAQYGEKTFLGAVLGGVLTLAIVLKALQFDARAYDVPVLPVLWGAAVGRVGCFLSGCCHGIETTAAWGVKYAALPAPVHPTQLYESALDVTLALLLTRHRARFDKPGTLALTGAVGIALIRFVVEPWRESAEAGFAGLTVVQLTTLAVIAIALLAMRWRTAGMTLSRIGPEKMPLRAALTLAAVAFITFIAREWLTPLEIILVGGVLFAATAFVAWRAMPRATLASPVIALGALAPLQGRDSTPEFEPRSWHAIGASVMAGGFEVTTEDCDGRTLSRQKHSYKAGGVSLETYTQEQPGVGMGARFTGFAATNTAPQATREVPLQPGESVPQSDMARDDRFTGATFAATLDRKYAGFTVGLATGKWNLHTDYPFAGPGVPSQTLPIAGLRVGKLTSTHVGIDVGTHTPTFAPAPLAKVYLGIGEKTGRNVFRVGFYDGGLMVSGRASNKEGFEVEPFLSLGSGQSQFGVGLKKRFYRKR